jgi:hypothetical protein
MIKNVIALLILFPNFSFEHHQEEEPVIYFREYKIEIRSIDKLNDTLSYNKSSKEDFKIVFFDKRGSCYLERFFNHKLYQRGYYTNSLDTLKRYVSGRDLQGDQSIISVQKYFEPLKNGEWVTYEGKKKIKETYLSGIVQK